MAGFKKHELGWGSLGLIDVFSVSQNLNETTDEGSMLNHLQELSQGIKAIQKRLDSLEVKTEGIDLLASKISTGFEMAEAVLGKIAQVLGVKEDANVGDDEEDRKRLKVRLKEALEKKRPHTDNSVIEASGYLEHYFGICRPNTRTGKHGSRFVRHPDSCRFPVGKFPEDVRA